MSAAEAFLSSIVDGLCQGIYAAAVSEIVFDKLSFVDRLKSGGIDEDQARVHAEALDIAMRETVATKTDIEKLAIRIDGELRLIKWMLALVIAATVIPLIRDLL